MIPVRVAAARSTRSVALPGPEESSSEPPRCAAFAIVGRTISRVPRFLGSIPSRPGHHGGKRRGSSTLPGRVIPPTRKQRATGGSSSLPVPRTGSPIFLDCLDDAEVMDDELAFEILRLLHQDAVQSGERARFAEHVRLLRDAGPRCSIKSAHTISRGACWTPSRRAGRRLSHPWRGLAERAGQDIDTVNRGMEHLRYHGQLDVLGRGRRASPGPS